MRPVTRAFFLEKKFPLSCASFPDWLPQPRFRFPSISHGIYCDRDYSILSARRTRQMNRTRCQRRSPPRLDRMTRTIRKV